MTDLAAARAHCRELGGPEVDLWTLPPLAVDCAARTGRPLPEVAHDVVSGWLAGRAVTGDADARARIVTLWRAPVLRWCRGTAASGVDAEDVAQDVLVRALRLLERFRGPTGFRPWMWSITWRVVREHERRPWRVRWVFGGVDVTRPSEAPGVDEALQGQERLAQIRAILAALPLEARTVLWLAYADGLTRSEIAGITGWSEGTVNRRLTQARARFRKVAERRGVAPMSIAQEVRA